jgi:cell division protein FtsB
VLAPLEDRSILEREDSASELADLRRALRENRRRLRRSAWQSTRQICALNAEIRRLQRERDDCRERLEQLASGVAIVELGQALMRLSANNDRLSAAARRVWQLEKNLAAAHAECARIAGERDSLQRNRQRPETGEAPQ